MYSSFLLLLFFPHYPEYCKKYAKPEDIGASPEDESSEEELSEDEYDSSDEQVVGKPDPWHALSCLRYLLENQTLFISWCHCK